MRVEPHSVDSVMHVIKRGARGMEIVRDDADRFNFVRTAFLLNDVHQSNDWRNYTMGKPLFYRPRAWPERRPLVSILAWTLLNNHFHMLLQEKEEGGVAKYMQRVCGSLTRYFNEKYDERGSIFQGSYKGRTITTDEYLRYVHAYIVVKNVFEMYPGGLEKAITQFESAWKFAGTYQFSSFLTAAENVDSPLLDIQAMHSFGLVRKDFKRYARSMLSIHAKTRGLPDDICHLLLEDW